ncbi:unnamed protein product [Sphagnum balticum]
MTEIRMKGSSDCETAENSISNDSIESDGSYNDFCEEDIWGWYDDDAKLKAKLRCDAVREAWFQISADRSTSASEKHVNHKQYATVLNIWINPSPEVSMKLSSGDDLRLLDNSMSMSCCVSGFRIAQMIDGECCAEFLTVFCYGSRSYSSWKSYEEFSELFQVVEYANRVNNIFPETVAHWRVVQSYSSWTKCLRVPHLIEKSIALGVFMQSLFSESPTPGLLLCFVQHSNFSII